MDRKLHRVTAAGMDQARFQQLEKIFHEALGIPPAERDGHLRQACGDNRQLLKTIRELLEAAQESQSAAGWRQMSEQDAELPQFGIFQAVRVLGRGGTGVVHLRGVPMASSSSL